jgi:hypothetical protein
MATRQSGPHSHRIACGHATILLSGANPPPPPPPCFLMAHSAVPDTRLHGSITSGVVLKCLISFCSGKMFDAVDIECWNEVIDQSFINDSSPTERTTSVRNMSPLSPLSPNQSDNVLTNVETPSHSLFISPSNSADISAIL